MSELNHRIEAIGLGHHFDSGWLFRHLSFELEPGHAVAVCGPSGSGKTTLLAIISDWLRPTEGSLLRSGVGRIGWVFQNPHGVAQRSAMDHVIFPLLAKGWAVEQAESRTLCIMADFGLRDVAHHTFGSLSGGEAQRLMLARAVASAPDVLLVDEPTAQLDRKSAAMVNATIAHVAREGSIVVIASHDPDTIAACESVIDLGDAA